MERKERENFFLRNRLFERLEEMEEEGMDLSWKEVDDSGTDQGKRMDRALHSFEKYKSFFTTIG